MNYLALFGDPISQYSSSLKQFAYFFGEREREESNYYLPGVQYGSSLGSCVPMYFGKIVNAHIRHAKRQTRIEKTKSICGTRSSSLIA